MPVHEKGLTMKEDWQRKKQRQIMFWVISVAVLLSTILGALMLFMNSIGRN